MKDAAFRSWMTGRYTPNAVVSRLSCARKVEEQYGDLDAHFESGSIEQVAEQLNYSLTDSKLGKPNPTMLTIGGNPYNVLNNCKNAVRTYKAFRADDGESEAANEATIELAAAGIVAKKEGKQFELEAHLQEFLREEVGQLEAGLTIVDGGVERSVNSGFIDILAQDTTGALVAIELKRGTAKRDAVGQILGYIGDLMAEEPAQKVRGIIVAAAFDKSCIGAVRAVPNLHLKMYRFSFIFEDVDVV